MKITIKRNDLILQSVNLPDHLIVMMRPISATYEVPPRVYRTVHTRPHTESGVAAFKQWIESESCKWVDIYTNCDTHKKAQIFQESLTQAYEKCFPIKSFKISDDDCPWMTKSLKKLDRLRKREFYKNKKSSKWEKLNLAFQAKAETEKEKYYANMVSDLKTSNVSQWFSKVKRMSGQEETRSDFTVDELLGLSDQDQAEKIADHYAGISQLYKPVANSDFPEYSVPPKVPPQKITPAKIEKIIKTMNKKSAGVPGDIPMKLISEFSFELSRPIAHIVNSCLSKGVYPDIWKLEYVTPVPKVHPPEKLSDLRRISGLLNLSKITDKIVAEIITEDMKSTRDRSQYGNEKKISLQHYLVKMLNKILTSLDQSSVTESMAVILTMVDWKQAFDRQSHILGVQSFIDNGVRPSMIPILLSFFQNRQMKVKWKGLLSKVRALPGGGPQGGTLGIEEYLSQSNGNTEFLDEEEKYKFIDDLSILEILNLVSIALSNYNFHSHIASDIGIDNNYLEPNSIKSQVYLDNIAAWTNKQEMKLNCDKTKYMIFNPSRKYQFNTRLQIENQKIEQVHETKLLGVILRDDFSFKSNTRCITKRAYRRMSILKNLYHFNLPLSEMLEIYTLYIRSVVEQAAVVWHSSITKGEELDLERVQKVALRIMLKD